MSLDKTQKVIMEVLTPEYDMKKFELKKGVSGFIPITKMGSTKLLKGEIGMMYGYHILVVKGAK